MLNEKQQFEKNVYNIVLQNQKYVLVLGIKYRCWEFFQKSVS